VTGGPLAKLGPLAERRNQLLAGGVALAGVVVVAVLGLGGLGGLGPTPEPSGLAQASASPRPATAADVLPGSGRTDVVLLVGSSDHLTDREQQWLADIGAGVGRVDAPSYASADAAALQRYLTIFVVDRSPELDPSALRTAFRAGLTVNLIGPGAEYHDAVAAP